MAQEVGIDHTLKVLQNLEVIVGSLAKIVKNGIGFRSMPAILGLASVVKNLIAEAQVSLPELKDVDAQEAGVLASAAYSLVRNVIGEISAPK